MKALRLSCRKYKRLTGVAGASSTGHDMTGHNGGTYGIEWEGKDPNDRTEFERVSVNYDFIELMGIEMKEGRTFSKDFGDEGSKIIFNEAGIKFMGMKDPIGKKVKLWDNDVEIIGVAKDFNFESFHEVVKPLFFFLNIKNCRNMMVRIEKGKEQETIARLEIFYKEFNPGFPFTYRFLDEDYQQLYASERRVATLIKIFRRAGYTDFLSWTLRTCRFHGGATSKRNWDSQDPWLKQQGNRLFAVRGVHKDGSRRNSHCVARELVLCIEVAGGLCVPHRS